jgi:predicted DNA-binding transcriptional regulator AlpA
MTKYLDIGELSALLGQSPGTIKKKIKTRPGCLPTPMHLPGTSMLRWRGHQVENWMTETGWSRPEPAPAPASAARGPQPKKISKNRL